MDSKAVKRIEEPRQNFWVGQICGPRSKFYKRSMAYKPQHSDWGVGETEISKKLASKLNGYDLLMPAKLRSAGNLSQNTQEDVTATNVCFLANFTELEIS